MKHKLIGITGYAHSGKDTAADYIIPFYNDMVKMSFADPLKDMLKIGLGLSDAQLYGNKKEHIDTDYGKSARFIMQTLGTEWGRDTIAGDVWLKAMDKRIQPFTIIPDVRFENEAQYIRSKGGLIVHIKGRDKEIDCNHESEHSIIVDDNFDIVVCNDGTIQDFYDNLYKTLTLGNL